MKTQAPNARRGRGRPAGQTGARDAILTQARRQFAEHGYRGTTLRSVATAAGVDARLVLHYFGSKQELFIESVELPIEPEQVIARVFEGGADGAGRRAAELMLAVLDDATSRRSLLALLRAAVTEPEAAALIRELLTQRMLLPIASRLGGSRPELRASFVASQLVGIVVVRYVVGLQPLAQASREEMVAALVPVFEHYLQGDWA
ncbi:MAG TPA: TetR family transcriptional regulator [Candidatus Limnocylindria bacterium]|jgi:AcrR family transcriptional regulator